MAKPSRRNLSMSSCKTQNEIEAFRCQISFMMTLEAKAWWLVSRYANQHHAIRTNNGR
jgi:hypothetical protein